MKFQNYAERSTNKLTLSKTTLLNLRVMTRLKTGAGAWPTYRGCSCPEDSDPLTGSKAGGCSNAATA